MASIQSVYILDGEGNTIFTLEKFTQGSDEIRQMLFQKFILAFQNFISEMGADETNIILGKSKISSVFDPKQKLYFVYKSDVDADSEEMRAIIKKIQLGFRRKLAEKKTSIQQLDSFFFDELKGTINHILEPKTNIQKFFEVLGF